MIKQMFHFKLTQNLFVAGIRLRMGSYRRFHTTQVRYRLMNNFGLHQLTFLLRGNILQNMYPNYPTANHLRTMDII